MIFEDHAVLYIERLGYRTRRFYATPQRAQAATVRFLRSTPGGRSYIFVV